MMNPGQGRNTHGRFVKTQLNRKAVGPEAECRPGGSVPLFLKQSKRSAKMKPRNTAVIRRRIDRRRIRNGVNGSYKEQQAQQPDDPFRFQIVLDGAKASPAAPSEPVLTLY